MTPAGGTIALASPICREEEEEEEEEEKEELN